MNYPSKILQALEVVADQEVQKPVHHLRVNNSLLAYYEHKVLAWLVARLPLFVAPDHMTVVGLFGAVFVLGGFVASHLSLWFLCFAFFGLSLNWLGDSLDGTIARYRNIERPDFGYFFDHSCDLISMTLIFVGLGLSPFFTMFSALLALSMYLLFSSYTYLKVLILKIHHLAYHGMGATELRILIMVWVFVAFSLGPQLFEAHFFGLRRFDLTILVMWSVVFVIFVWKVWSDVRHFRPILDK